MALCSICPENRFGLAAYRHRPILEDQLRAAIARAWAGEPPRLVSVVGPPGSGKSWLLGWLAKEGLSQDEGWWPVLLLAPQVVQDELLIQLRHFLQKRLPAGERVPERLPGSSSTAYLMALLRFGREKANLRPVLLLDEWDALSVDRRADVEEQVVRAALDAGALVVVARSSPFVRLPRPWHRTRVDVGREALALLADHILERYRRHCPEAQYAGGYPFLDVFLNEAFAREPAPEHLWETFARCLLCRHAPGRALLEELDEAWPRVFRALRPLLLAAEPARRRLKPLEKKVLGHLMLGGALAYQGATNQYVWTPLLRPFFQDGNRCSA